MGRINAGSGCINHPGVEAAARCRQCGKPVCGACVVSGPTGKFCCEECKGKHENFVQRAEQLDVKKRRGTGMLVGLRRLIVKGIILVAVVLFGAGAATYFGGFEIPVLSDIIRRILSAF
ncbi:MAG: hypothetical protein QG656_886 [Candidatus Hydrogenedentes bacterium]|nr:hypothetical protein [Candidatus Hydrogenedentota bacterium]